MRLLYSMAWYLASPVVAIWLLQRALREPGWGGGVRDRLGIAHGLKRGGLWVHAASVGEVQAALPLLFELRMRYPDLPLTLTTFTPSGRSHARQQLPDAVDCRLLPFDLPGATRRFLRALSPRIGIVVETELWPNLFAACRRAEVPLVMVSARLTEPAAVAWRRWPRLAAGALSVPEVISAQTVSDAERIQVLGADPTRVTIGGNFKFDFRLPGHMDERIRTLGEETGLAHRTIWIAASTHEGEDEQVLAAHARVREDHPDALLVLAPRHPSRAESVVGLVERAGFKCVRRSDQTPASDDTAVLMVDTLGELSAFYGLARVAFVGGSLVDVGGHNLLEPAALGLPVLSGPHTGSVTEMFDLMVAADAVTTVTDGESLGREVSALLGDEDARDRRGQAAARVLEENRGAVARAMQLIEGILDR